MMDRNDLMEMYELVNRYNLILDRSNALWRAL